jgi:CRP-like cAMP-binding protein
MHDDFIVRLGDQADKLFFIHSGYIEILDKNGIDPVMYCSKGAYFGEVGVMITGVRTLSVRSKSNSVMYYITKDDLLSLLDQWPKELEFLKSVARQRLDTR